MTAKGSTYSSVNITKDNVVRHIISFRVQYYKIRTIIISTTFMARFLTILIGQLNVLLIPRYGKFLYYCFFFFSLMMIQGLNIPE